MDKIPCTDCGATPVNHKTEYRSALINWLLQPIFRPMDILWRNIIGPSLNPLLTDYFTPAFLKTLARFNIASIINKPDPAKDELMLQCLWSEADKRNIKIQEYVLLNQRRGLCIAEHNNTIHSFDRLPRPKNSFSDSINWMDDKAVLKKKLAAVGIPVSRGQAVFSLAAAKKVFGNLEKPVVTKPHTGSATRHTTMHITNETKLAAAFNRARQLSPLVIIEEELAGPVYRITSIGGKIIGVIRRDQPQVIGTGRSTIKTLVEKENQHPKRQGPIFSKIATDIEANAELTRQNLTWDSIPKKGQVVMLNQKINWGIGGTTTDVTASVHPDNMKLFEKISLFINDPLIGIDFIIADITKPWTTQTRCGVIECNSLPFIDNHHLPFNGEPRNAAGALWDIVFPASAGRPDSKTA